MYAYMYTKQKFLEVIGDTESPFKITQRQNMKKKKILIGIKQRRSVHLYNDNKASLCSFYAWQNFLIIESVARFLFSFYVVVDEIDVHYH